ncbi:MAG: hypothetical protein AB8F95_03565 [Bacteroidia bacterium]
MIFGLGLIFSKLLGAVLGDWLLGNKATMLIGGVLQVIGGFCIAFLPSEMGFYCGLGLILIGNGLYSSNFYSGFAKQYLHKPHLLDTAFTMVGIVGVMAAHLGITLIPYVSVEVSYSTAFSIASCAGAVALLFPIFYNETNPFTNIKHDLTFNKRLLYMSVFVFLGMVFWVFSELTMDHIIKTKYDFSANASFNIPSSFMLFLNSAFYIPFAIIAALAWFLFRVRSSIKVGIGMLFGAIGFGMYVFLPEVYSINFLGKIIASAFFLTLTEILLEPTITAVVARYANPKYLTTALAISFVPINTVAALIPFLNDSNEEGSMLAFTVGTIVLSVLGAATLVYGFGFRNKIEA